MKTPSFFSSENRERNFYYFVAFLLFIAYFVFSIALSYQGKSGARTQNLMFGFSQIRFLLADSPILFSILRFAIAAALLSAGVIWIQRYKLPSNVQIPITIRATLSALSVGMFFFLRTNFINSDGLSFPAKFAEAVPLKGFFATHDEILEFYIHSRFWYYTNQFFGWSVGTSYLVLSCFAGGVFVFLLLTYIPRVSAEKPYYAFLLCIAGGYMQLFFGDIENYTLTTAWIMGYFLASAMFLEKKIPLTVPAALLATAMMFHLVAGFLPPSLLFLFFSAWRRSELGAILYAAGAFVLIIGLTLLVFHLIGLPIHYLWTRTNATGIGGRFSMFAPFTFNYYSRIFNLIFLLLPAWILLIPLVIYKRLMLDEINYHLIIASIFMGGFVLLWRAYLGVYQDWNLFAPAALPISLLVWRSAMRIESVKTKISPLAIFGWLALFHSYSWILMNHFNPK